MGIYIFKCLHGDYVKLGHHLVCPRRPNAYYRVAGRGFYSCKHPECLDDKLGIFDLELVAWYPTLSRAEEKKAHNLTPKADRVGEFHPLSALDTLTDFCDGLAARVDISASAKKRAIAWGARRARRAKRAAVRRRK